MRKVKLLLGALAVALAVPLMSGHGEEPDKDKDKDKVAMLMRKKLENSQKVLEGVTTGDFKLIAKHADELIAISKEAEWKVLKTPRYEVYSNDFRAKAEELIKNADDKNLDAAALSYVDLTLTCVKCHKYVRAERMTRRD
jgi:hypothetical protein